MKYLILFSTLICTTVNATCNQPVTYLQESAPSPCKGFLFTEDKELEVRIKVANFDLMAQQVQKEQDLVSILNNRVNNQLELNNKLTEQLENRNENELWKILGAFTIGAVITSVIATHVGK